MLAAHPDDARAGDVYVAALEPRPGGRLLRGARLLGAFVAEFLGMLPTPSVSDVVVRRRDDGTEVLRVEAGDPAVPGDTLHLLQQQLETMTAGRFREEWNA